MHPAFSILFFTTFAGSAQGLVVALALASLFGVPMAPGMVSDALLVAELLLLAGLADPSCTWAARPAPGAPC